MELRGCRSVEFKTFVLKRANTARRSRMNNANKDRSESGSLFQGVC